MITRLGSLPCLVSGDGPPLVLLAGLLPRTGVEWAQRMHEQTAAPYAARRTVHYVNRRPGIAPGTTIGALAAEHAAAIRDAFDGPVDVLGLSTGGSIAQQLAADRPDVVRRLVLLATGCRLSAETRGEMRRIAARVHAGAPRRALACAAAALLPPGPWRVPAALAAALAGPRAIDASDLADMAATIELEDTFDLAGWAGTIAAPTLIVTGERDRFYPAELVRETASLIPGATLHVEPGRGHMTVGGVPAVHQRILDHLDGR